MTSDNGAADSLKTLMEQPLWKEEKRELEEARIFFADVDREHLWAFVSGQQSQDFRGNPKYLFLYINRFRKDIFAYWYSGDPETVELIRSLGYEAYYTGTAKAAYVFARTGVLAAENVIPPPTGMEGAKLLNLWHGVGQNKWVERAVADGHLMQILAKKYIERNSYYRFCQLYVSQHMRTACPCMP